MLLALEHDKVFEVSEAIDIKNRFVRIGKSGAGANPIVDFNAYVNGSNHLYGFKGFQGGHMQFDHVDIRLPSVSPAPGSAWSTLRSVMNGGRLDLSFCSVTGGVAKTTLGLINPFRGKHVTFEASNSSLDGPIAGLVFGGRGTATVAKDAVTLLNGAAITDGSGEIGVNILM
ncbi:MAG TPA: hypothetical protein ENK80_04765, partial [Rhodobacterales bacterium]|nr:hypothetical protein [Rhodobacterales bacterium]